VAENEPPALPLEPAPDETALARFAASSAPVAA
jgi:hypothetical protein